MGAGNYSLVATVVTGDIITASERNTEHQNHINNHDFPGLDDYSTNATQMQTVTDPYPASSESLPTSGAGELERIRYQIKAILQAIGTTATQWYHDAPAASDFSIATTGIGIVSGDKFFLDGIAQTGDTYIYESAANTFDLFTAGTRQFRSVGGVNTFGVGGTGATPIGVVINGGSGSGGGPYLQLLRNSLVNHFVGHESVILGNNSDDLLIYAATSQDIKFAPNGTESLCLLSGGNAAIGATAKLFFDGVAGTGNTYITEVSADVLRIVVGGTNVCTFRTTLVDVDATIDLSIQATKKLYLDGGSDTYIYEISADAIGFVLGGTERVRFGTSFVYVPSGTVGAPGVAFYSDAGNDSGLYLIGANNIGVAVGGAKVLDVSATGLGVTGDVFSTALTDYSATSTVTGWTSFTTKKIYYKTVGKTMVVHYYIAGTSNSITTYFTLPNNAAAGPQEFTNFGSAVDNGGAATVAYVHISPGSATVNAAPTLAGGAWTNSGTKLLAGMLVLEIA